MTGPALAPGQIWQESAACGLLGLCLGGARAFFAVRGRAAFWPDVLFMGAALLAAQSYAAALSVGGALRWYMLAALFGAAALATRLLRPVFAAAGRLVTWPLRSWAARHRKRRQSRKNRAKLRRNEKRLAKKAKKNLPSMRRLLYNSNVPK